MSALTVSAGAQAAGQQGVAYRQAPTREQVREAVMAHRAAEHEQIQRDEAMAGRRLTAAERSELRAQLRHEWAQRAATTPEPAAPATAHKSSWSWRDILPWGRSSTP
ncbi:hypothetical protein PGB34_13960 [Xenophilus arseniciresistens]|uniref:Uncharacterized protein n=1 Tax=Xenophilus arseniciresistens TaxID=1283306 RepID=A0AAE3T0Z4_9BURK|nr:hypothetical protein [Xenophilus arseniciresistens]MDA7417471.1 hypothetical protein [Xenophilus arseniciresistens]